MLRFKDVDIKRCCKSKTYPFIFVVCEGLELKQFPSAGSKLKECFELIMCTQILWVPK